MRARLRCPTTLLVITLRDSVAAWCRTPIALDDQMPGSVIRPVVLGPDQLPRVTDLELARRLPELAVLSAATHGRDDDQAAAELAWTALLACDGLDTPRATRYSDLVWASLGQAARRILEEDVMGPQTYEYQSEHVRRYVNQGRDEGRREGRREAFLELLAARFGDLSDPVRQRVEQADFDQLKRWNTRVIDLGATLEQILDLEP